MGGALGFAHVPAGDGQVDWACLVAFVVDPGSHGATVRVDFVVLISVLRPGQGSLAENVLLLDHFRDRILNVKFSSIVDTGENSEFFFET